MDFHVEAQESVRYGQKCFMGYFRPRAKKGRYASDTFHIFHATDTEPESLWINGHYKADNIKDARAELQAVLDSWDPVQWEEFQSMLNEAYPQG